MYLKTLKILNFRNIENIEIELNKNVNIFIGDNAQGKTSILESIYNLAFTKNSISDEELLKRGTLFYKVKGILRVGNTLKNLEVLYSENDKKLKINNNEIKRVSDYISNMNVIMFTPDDLDIIKKSPLIRRNFINMELCQLSNKYLVILNEYNKILKMRNDYIRKNNGHIDYKYLDVLTENLINRMILIYEYREKYFEDINKFLDSIFYKIIKKNGLKVVYKKSVSLKDKNNYIEFYKNNYNLDIENGMTMYGPHRDDFYFSIDNEDLKYYGSQGMQRVAILSFKLSEINLFKERTGNYPIILLDDIFSELDLSKRKNLLKFIKNGVQFIITTTDINNISEKIISKASVFTVSKGSIKQRSDISE